MFTTFFACKLFVIDPTKRANACLCLCAWFQCLSCGSTMTKIEIRDVCLLQFLSIGTPSRYAIAEIISPYAVRAQGTYNKGKKNLIYKFSYHDQSKNNTVFRIENKVISKQHSRPNGISSTCTLSTRLINLLAGFLIETKIKTLKLCTPSCECYCSPANRHALIP